MAAIDLKNCVISFKSGLSGTTIHGIDIKVGEGNLTWSEAKTVEYKLEKGKIGTATVREGDEVPMDVSFSFTWEWYTNSILGTRSASSAASVVSNMAISGIDISGSAYLPTDPSTGIAVTTANAIATEEQRPIPSPIDVLKKVGYAADWPASESSTDRCAMHSIDIWIRNSPVCSGDSGSEEFYILHHFRYEKLDFDLKAGTISCSGKCKAKEAEVIRTITNAVAASVTASGMHMGYNVV